MNDIETRLSNEPQQARIADILGLLPRGRNSILDIGARYGDFSRLLTEHFESVTALDLEKPSFEFPRLTTVAGDVTRLQFADSAFDCVLCAEVLEHVPDVELACREIARVARHEVVIGVPYKQDIRIGRTTCRACGKVNPPWGHVNRFDEARLAALFPGLTLKATSFVGSFKSATNPISTLLMDMAGNPYGSYAQLERCIYCNAQLQPPPDPRSFASRVCSGIAARINAAQTVLARSHSVWMHVVFAKGDNGR